MDARNKDALLPEMRLDFWDELWHGQITNMRALQRRLSVLALPISIEAPCCRCVLRLRHGDAYLNEIWRYGRNRLRLAVGNLLPGDREDIVYGVCRLTPYHIYIVACATGGQTVEQLADSAGEDIGRLIRSLEEYLDLHSELKEITPIASIAALAGGK